MTHLRFSRGSRFARLWLSGLTTLSVMYGHPLAASAANATPNTASNPESSETAQSAWKESFRVQAPASQNLRGFGRVETDFAGFQNGAQQSWVLAFRCENAEKAAVVIGKFLADVGLSPKVGAVRLTTSGKDIPSVTVANGSTFLGCLNGSEGRIVCSTNKETLEAFLTSHLDLAQGAVEKAAYPTYLDRFDRYGWGTYGLDGNRDTFGWMEDAAKTDGKPGYKDPLEDLDWLVKGGFRFEPHLDAAGALQNADGIIANSDDDWSVKAAQDKGLGVSFRLYGSVNSDCNGWALRRFGEYQNQPADFLRPRNGSYAVDMMQSWYAPDVHGYQAVKAMEMVQKYTNEPNVMGWMHPYGEIQVGDWPYDHGDYSPSAQANWHEYLQKHGYDLSAASRIYNRKLAFGDWDQIPVPEFATFAGLDEQIISLGGQWWSRREVPLEQVVDEAWWKKSAEERYQGLREKWWNSPIEEKDWKLVKVPGDAGLPDRTSLTCTTWLRRDFPLTANQITKKPIYLYWFPISHEGTHSGEHKRYNEVYLNGTKAGEIGGWGAIDVSRFIKAGDNKIALQLYGDCFQGRIFLSTEEPKIFPGLAGEKNQLWILWRQWLVDAPLKAMATVFDGMRQADPNRPIKIMAPGRLGSTGYLGITRDYGAFPHFTGEGMWFFPWYKRYAFLYDVPGSSETAGPASGIDPACKDQFDAYRRVFMEGLNSHDSVFFTQEYSRSPYLRAWWDAHQSVLHQLGRYDLSGPQVLIFRSNLLEIGIVPTNPYPPIGDASRAIQSAWNWDLGRGTLQTLGQSYLYLDEKGVADSKMNGYKVMIDCGNEIMADESIQGIGEWVKTGGTFIALPFTGRSSLLKPDSWPAQKLTGCSIGKQRTLGQGTVTIKPEQSIFKTNAGKTFSDKGTCTDWNGNELNAYNLELQPGADCEVLATYENGEPAVVKHRLGQGSVITFGSLFWRNNQDIRGLWRPKTPEAEVISDLLNGLGQQALCETDGHMIWPQPFRSNNGLDSVTVLTSWNEKEDAESTLRLRLPAKPAALMSFGVDGEKELPFTWKDGIAETKVTMPAREVKVVRAIGATQPFDAVSHWWNYQQRMWHELVKSTIDFTPYRQGKFADPTVDLRPQAKFTNQKPADDLWMQPGFDDKGWKTSPLSMFRVWGAEPGKPLWVRKTFTVPEAWHKQAGQIRLICQAGGGSFGDPATVLLNGKSLDQTGHGFADNHIDAPIDMFLNEGQNVLTLQYAGKTPVQSIQGEVYLYFRPTPALSIPLGLGEQMVTIPRSWEKKYRVMLYLEGARYEISHAEINDHALNRARPYPAPAEYNLAAYLKYGQDNRIWINPGKNPGDIKISRLDLFPIDQ